MGGPMKLLSTIVMVVVVVGLSSCRFEVPDTNEQRALVERGSFPSGAPLWVSGTVEGAERQHSTGVIPEYVVPPAAVYVRSDESRAMMREREDRQEKEVPVTKEQSPLARIMALCPGLDTQVNAALTTVNHNERIARYESLTRDCSASADLWLWLGQDYLKAGQFPQAQAAFERVLMLDAANAEAKSGLDEVQKLAASAGKP